MLNLLASAAAALGLAWSSLFGGHTTSLVQTVVQKVAIQQPTIEGMVMGVHGSTITLQGHASTDSSPIGIYTVNASNASVLKRGVSNATVSNISFGDKVTIRGSVSGTTVNASVIADGVSLPAQAAAPATTVTQTPRPTVIPNSVRDDNMGGDAMTGRATVSAQPAVAPNPPMVAASTSAASNTSVNNSNASGATVTNQGRVVGAGGDVSPQNKVIMGRNAPTLGGE